MQRRPAEPTCNLDQSRPRSSKRHFRLKHDLMIPCLHLVILMMDDLSGEFPFRLFTPKLRYRLYQPDDTAARCGGFIPSGEVIRWRAWCEAPYLRHYNGVFSTSAVAADTNHADLQTSLVRLGRIELPRVSCSSLPFTKCRILPHWRSTLYCFPP